MIEKTFMFGTNKNLLGITTDPQTNSSQRNRTAVILLNSGLIHRVGPNRVYVKIARTLAAAGFVVLRFDLSGIGDSKPRTDDVLLDERAICETREAMDSLSQTRGVEHFVLVGICSGADDAIRVSVDDSRVVGAVLIDALTYPSTAFQLHSYSKRMLRLQSWLDLLSGKSDFWRTLRHAVLSRFRQPATEANWDWPTLYPDELVPMLAALIERGVKLSLIFSDNGESYFNYRCRLKKRLMPWMEDDRLAVHLISGSDHSFTQLHHQQELADLIRVWAAGLKQVQEPPVKPPGGHEELII